MCACLIHFPIGNFVQERYPIIRKARLLNFRSARFTAVCIVVFVFVVLCEILVCRTSRLAQWTGKAYRVRGTEIIHTF
jgi:hypothetical protein